jgi:signal transduction histidine kinase
MSHKVILTFLLIYFSVDIALSLRAQEASKSTIDSLNSLHYQSIVSNIEPSIEIFSRNVEDAKELNYKYGLATAYNKLGLAYYLNGQYDKSTDVYLKAIDIYDQLNDSENLSATYGEFGYQLKRRDLKKANYYMRLAIDIAEKNEHDSILTKHFDNYGVLKEMENQLDSAEYYYNIALERKSIEDDSIGIPYTLNKLAGINRLKGNEEKAFTYIRQSDSYRKYEEGMFGKAENLALYGDIYKTFGYTDSAIIAYNQCLNISLDEGINYLVRYSHKNLTDLYRQKGLYEEAYNNLQKYTTYQDSVLNADIQKKIAQLEIRYETAKKDRQILENKLKLSKLSSRLYLLGGIAVILALLSFGVYHNQKKKRERIKKELHLQNQLSKAELENKINEEKLRISRELHDNIGSQLTFIISSLDNLNYVEEDISRKDKLTRLSKFGKDTLQELRNTIWAMKNQDADFDYLILKITELVQHLNSNIDGTHIAVNNNINNDIQLSSTQMLNIYRIVQEALQNSIKYSNAEQIDIAFTHDGNSLFLKIEDNGDGMTTDTTELTKGNGIKNMKIRCEECGGELILKSSSDGTSITCSISIN